MHQYHNSEKSETNLLRRAVILESVISTQTTEARWDDTRTATDALREKTDMLWSELNNQIIQTAEVKLHVVIADSELVEVWAVKYY